MTGIGNLLYEEDLKMRVLLSEDFSFVYDKETFTSLSWGKTKEEDPKFNPIGPEMVQMNIGSDFVFDSGIIKRLISLDTGDEASFASVLTNARLSAKSFEFLYSDEVRRLVDWLESKAVFTEFCVPEQYAGKFKNVVKMKSLGVKNARLSSSSPAKVNENVNKMIENGMNVTLSLSLKEDTVDVLAKFITDCSFPVNVDLVLDEEMSESSLKRVEELVKGNALIYIKNDTISKAGVKHGDALVREYSFSLLDCVFDFENDKIPVGRERNPVKLSECKSIMDYWQSPSFKKIRSKALKKLS